jgi:hypothetical protein
VVSLKWENHHHPYNICGDAVNVVQNDKHGAQETFAQKCNAAEKYYIN